VPAGNMRWCAYWRVEDERKLAEVLSSALQAEHYDVVVARTGEDGFYRANAELYDLVLLDLMSTCR
jgi:DNA-binding response OmpR family regulator